MNYSLIDSGGGRKLERFGPILLARPCAQAVWKPALGRRRWQEADASFTRDGKMRWQVEGSLPDQWRVEVSGLLFKVAPTNFGHLGVFPEHAGMWEWMHRRIISADRPVRVLNLFAYSGGATLACARAGAEVCHLDASKGMVAWARENAALNDLSDRPIRWIVDDAMKFLGREIRRGRGYDAIILDPPSFGRGSRGEVFKIEQEILPLLESCQRLLSESPLFVLFSCHTPGFTPMVMRRLLDPVMKPYAGVVEPGELMLRGADDVLPVPSGTYARWAHD